jgi:NAD(P)-dependent dehydrogenase (short-subunit alcohol dehydrogenase family)
VLACRDKDRAQAAVDQLTSGTAMPGQVETMSLGLASLASIRAFTAELRQRLDTGTLPPLHAVVCNAGVNPGPTNTVTADGFESTFGIIHLGHFRLVYDLLPALQGPARVVVVASGVHDPAQKSGVLEPAWSDPHALAWVGPAHRIGGTQIGQALGIAVPGCSMIRSSVSRHRPEFRRYFHGQLPTDRATAGLYWR